MTHFWKSPNPKIAMPYHPKLSGFLAILYIIADTNKITDNVRPLTQIVPIPIPEASLPSGEPSFTLKLKIKPIIIVSMNTTRDELANIVPIEFVFTLNLRLHLGQVNVPL